MDELGQLILGEKPSKVRELDRSSVIAPKKAQCLGLAQI